MSYVLILISCFLLGTVIGILEYPWWVAFIGGGLLAAILQWFSQA